jgi:hypothetical protein
MGYTTDFGGSFTVSPPMKREHAAYINKFCETRRMKRKTAIAQDMDDPIRRATGLPLGKDAAYFVGGRGDFGQDMDESVVENNRPPEGQPGLWCQWVVSVDPDDGKTYLMWDQGEKFYNYVEWLEYMVEHFFKPWGYTIKGEVRFVGEDADVDRGIIYAKDNNVEQVYDSVSNAGPSWR